jgi:hypothetical protein
MNTTESVIERFKALHGDLYDYSNVNYVNHTAKVEIICHKHGSFFKTVETHCKGRGCPVCAQSNRRYTLETLLEKFESVHSNIYDYSNVVFENVRSKVIIICKTHGSFEQRADQHIQGYGCPHCGVIKAILSGIKYSNKKNQPKKLISVPDKQVTTIYTLNSLIEKFNLVHNYAYDYSNIHSYKNIKQVVTIVCKEHGSFEQRVTNHIQGAGCQKCGVIKAAQSNKSYPVVTTESLIDEFKQIHGDLYDYSKTVYVNFKTKVAINCRKHGIFMQRSRCHASGKGCPVCRSSKGESRIREFFKDNNIDFVEQYPICKNPKTGSYLRADFYLPSFNTCIEYDGRQHFEPTTFFGGENGFDELQYRDQYKNTYCQENDIKLIRISYKEYAKIHNILSVFNSEVVYE